MHLYCSNNAITLLNAAKSLKIRSTINCKNSKFTHISSTSQLASQPAIRPSYASCMAPEFLHSKGNHIGFMKPFIHCTMVLPFILYYLAFIFKSLTEG